jgi:bacterioferritin-associated ferredoxin
MYVCICNAVTDREIRATVALGAGTLSEVSAALGVATSCGRCREHAQDLIDDCRACEGHRACNRKADSLAG